MKALRITFAALFYASIIHTSWQKEILTPENDICRLFKNGVELRKPGFCSQSIKCENHKSVDGITCPEATKFYNRDTKKCAKTNSDTYCKTPCVASSPMYVSDKKNCAGWYICKGKTEVKSSYCDHGQIFDQKKQLCMYETTCEATYELCDVAPAGVAFQDEINCNKYHECTTKGKIETKSCEAGKYFDRNTGECFTKALVDCPRHPYPLDVCGNKKLAIRGKFVDDEATCRGYFFCKDLGAGKPDTAPVWGQCTPDQFFNAAEGVCAKRTHLSCSEDRCDGRKSGRELSERPGCQHYLECKDGYTLSEESCGAGLYFNIETQTCTSVQVLYPICS